MGIWPLLYEVTGRVIPHLLVASLSDVEEILSPGRTQADFPQNRHRPSVLASRTLEDHKNFIRDALTQFAQNKGFVAGIWHEGRLAGAIGYDPIDWENRTTELGYWLGEEYQGKGLVTAACRALVEPAFGELSLNRVVISCATENKKSCAIPERLGFRREGVQRQAEWLYHHFVDHVVYAALASEWPTQRS
jgi:ribosomal-protein-serine acetyltransferase